LKKARWLVPVSRRIALALSLVLAGLSLGGTIVSQDPNAFLPGMKTYAWRDGTAAPDPAAERLIRETVSEELASHGMVEVAEAPDLLIYTHATRGGLEGLDPEAFVYGGYPQHGWGLKTKGASLVVDVLGRDSQTILWRGMVTGSLPVDREKRLNKIPKVIRKLFKQFPRD
jgi:hypothetical protein